MLNCRSLNVIVALTTLTFAHPCEAQVISRVSAVPFTSMEKAAFVKAHNDARQAVGAAAVEWSDDLANFASEWLTAQTESMKMQAAQDQFPNPGHRPREGTLKQRYGENVAIWGGTPGRVSADPAQAVAQWLKEKPAFDKLNEAKSYVVGDEQGQLNEKGEPIVVGHYTQLVWKSTRRIGAGRVIIDVSDDAGKPSKRYVVIVCNFDPPGNFLGQKP